MTRWGDAFPIRIDRSCRCEGTGRRSRGATIHDGAFLPCTCHGCLMADPCREPGCRFVAFGRDVIMDGAVSDATPADLDALLRRKP